MNKKLRQSIEKLLQNHNKKANNEKLFSNVKQGEISEIEVEQVEAQALYKKLKAICIQYDLNEMFKKIPKPPKINKKQIREKTKLPDWSGFKKPGERNSKPLEFMELNELPGLMDWLHKYELTEVAEYIDAISEGDYKKIWPSWCFLLRLHLVDYYLTLVRGDFERVHNIQDESLDDPDDWLSQLLAERREGKVTTA